MKISVIITAHNRKSYLERAFKSVINQTINHELFEIIVVKNFQDEYFDNYATAKGAKLILVPPESIVGYDMYTGMTESTGNIVCFLDDDDVFDQNRLERIFSIFTDNSISYFRNSQFYLDDNDNIIQRNFKFELHQDTLLDTRVMRAKLSYLDRIKAGFNLSSMAFDRKIVGKNELEFMKSYLIQSTDTFIFSCAICSEGTIYLSKEKLTGYRLNDSTSKTRLTDNESIMKQMDFWKVLLSSYMALLDLFCYKAKHYLQIRIISQEIAIKKLSTRFGVKTDTDFSYSYALACAIKTRNLLIFYDIFIILRNKLFFRANERINKQNNN